MTDALTAYRIETTHTIDEDGKPDYRVEWDDGTDDARPSFVTALGMLDLARDVIMRDAFGRY